LGFEKGNITCSGNKEMVGKSNTQYFLCNYAALQKQVDVDGVVVILLHPTLFLTLDASGCPF
jgi:hypothetical protein